mgnify:CR=1 FL=1
MGTKFGAKAAHFLIKQCIKAHQQNGESEMLYVGHISCHLKLLTNVIKYMYKHSHYIINIYIINFVQLKSQSILSFGAREATIFC